MSEYKDEGIYTLQGLMDEINRLVADDVPLNTPLIISVDAEGNEHHYGVYFYTCNSETWEVQPWGSDNFDIRNPLLLSPGGAQAEHLWDSEDEDNED